MTNTMNVSQGDNVTYRRDNYYVTREVMEVSGGFIYYLRNENGTIFVTDFDGEVRKHCGHVIAKDAMGMEVGEKCDCN